MMPQLKLPNLPHILDSVDQIIDQYDLFLVDLWGVTHNGLTPFPGALAFFKAVKQKGKKIVLLSNAPRMPQASIARLTEMGIERNLYDEIYTSGYHCYTYLKERLDPFYKKLGNKVYHYGPDRDLSLIKDLVTYTPVKNLEDADFVLATSTLNWDDTIETITPFLQEALALKLPMICANADKVVLRGCDSVMCVGEMGLKYQEMGGSVRMHGKPNAELFTAAHKNFPNISKAKTIMIGDSFFTDIGGANAYGIDSLFVLSGILGDRFKNAWPTPSKVLNIITELQSEYNALPTYVAEVL